MFNDSCECVEGVKLSTNKLLLTTTLKITHVCPTTCITVPLSCNIINTSIMHIPSQAVITMGEEEGKNIPRRYNQTSTSKLPILNQKKEECKI
jgi:hypothetical protein